MSNEGSADVAPISAEEALRDIAAPQSHFGELEYLFDRRFEVQSVEAERAYEKLSGLRDHFRHKKYWSFFLMGLMAAMVIFQSLLIYQVGIGAWNFKGYDWLLPTLMIQYLIQIVGLAVFVVRSLFKEME